MCKHEKHEHQYASRQPVLPQIKMRVKAYMHNKEK